MTRDEPPTRISIAAGPLVGPVLRRVVGMLAARADLPLDRLDDAVLVADAVAARAPAYMANDTVDVAFATRPRAIDLRVGPLRAGGGRALVVDAAVPGVGNVIEQLADELDVETEAGSEFLVLRLAYAEPDQERGGSGSDTLMALEFGIEDRRVDDDTQVVSVRGEIDLFTAPEFKQHVMAPVGAGVNRVIVDLTETTFIDSSSLGVLIGANRRLKARGGRLLVACTAESVVKTFKVTGLDGVFAVLPTLEEALARGDEAEAAQEAAEKSARPGPAADTSPDRPPNARQ